MNTANIEEYFFLSQVVSYLSCFFISLSIAAFCASTLPGIRKGGDIMGNPHGLEILEIVCSSFFTLEFLVRVIFCPKTIEFFKKPMNWIDLISILPFYVSYFFHDDKVKMLLVIRVMRLFRWTNLYLLTIYKIEPCARWKVLNGHTLGFDLQTQKLEPPCTA